MCTTKIDIAKVNSVEEKLLEILNAGSLAVMISIGHRTGLFDVLNELTPSSSDQIAKAAELNERYVREWLNTMTAGGFISYNPDEGTYLLLPEFASCLTRKSSPNNMAVYAQYIPLLGDVEDKIIDCFTNGGGLEYTEYKRFHQVMEEDSSQTVVSALFNSILPLVDGIEEKLYAGIKVLDIGCGRGKALTTIAEKYPKSSFKGVDLSEEAIGFANDVVNKKGLTNIRFIQKDVTNLDNEFGESFDFITTFDAIHDQAAPAKVLKGIYNSLKDNGVYLMQDIAGSSYVENNLEHPMAPFLYTISTMHCMSVSLAQGGEGLGTMWGKEKACNMLKEAGFENIDVKQLDHDFQNNFYVIKKT